MSLKRNIIASYISQGYTTAVGIVIVPLYIKEMGAEAYGLVGFFTMLQAWFNMLDLGLTPTIGRETARYHAGAMLALDYRRLFRALTLVFAGVGLAGGAILWLLSDFIAHRWLSVTSLSQSDVVLAVEVMAVSAALRWVGGLYRGVIAGSERLVWLSSFNAFIATLRFIAPLGTMVWFGFRPVPFFIHQFVVAAIELIGLAITAYGLLPEDVSRCDIGWSIRPIQSVLKFSLMIAFTSSAWILVTQTDKLLLSGILPLYQYGYFSVAVLLASGIMMISGPISSAIMPRMAKLHAENKDTELISIYRRATQVVSVVAGAAAIFIATQAEPLLYVWTGNAELAKKASGILRLYALGNGLLAVGAFPFYLQYALGNLRYHLIGNIVLVSILTPAFFIAASRAGGVGAGYVWVGGNFAYLLFWVGLVHYKLRPGLHLRWLSRDVLAILVVPVFIGMLSRNFISLGAAKTYILGVLFLVGCLVLGSAAMARRILNRLR